MQIENIWTALMALILGIGASISLLPGLTNILNIAEPEAKLFLAIIIGIVGFLVVLIVPINVTTQDDRGKIS